ncbi:MAG: MBL fold metallo-hydrolase [Candidatus Gracilibacteria bacterium]
MRYSKSKFALLILLSLVMSFSACADEEWDESIGSTAQKLQPFPPGTFEAFSCVAPTLPHADSAEALANVCLVEPSLTTPLPPGCYINVRKANGEPRDGENYLNHGCYAQLIKGNTYTAICNDFQISIYANTHGFDVQDFGGSNAGLPPFKYVLGQDGRIVFGQNGQPQLELDQDGHPIFQRGGQEFENFENILRDIAALRGKDYDTNYPIISLGGTHPHSDHFGGSIFLKYKYPNLRIVLSKQQVDLVRAYRLPIAVGDDGCYDFVNARPKDNCNYRPYWPRLPSQREIITDRDGYFRSGGKKFRVLTPVTGAHSLADSAYITPNRVVMYGDMLGTEGRLSFVRNSVADFTLGVIMFNRVLLGEAGYECDVTDPTVIDSQTGLTQGVACEQAGPTRPSSWDVILGGHFNVGYAKDLIHTLRYYRAQYEAWHPVMFGATQGGIPLSPMQFAPEGLNTAFPDRILEGVFHAVETGMATLNAERYHTSPFWASANGDMREMNESMFLYKNALNGLFPPDFNNPMIPPGGIIDFGPIQPGDYPFGDKM